ncbi:MAG: hypothetical protein N2C14_24890, partial [Planctomycetales bacterium]
EWGQHYQEPLWKAIGEGASVDGKSRRAEGTGNKTSKKQSAAKRRKSSKTTVNKRGAARKPASASSRGSGGKRKA